MLPVSYFTSDQLTGLMFGFLVSLLLLIPPIVLFALWGRDKDWGLSAEPEEVVGPSVLRHRIPAEDASSPSGVLIPSSGNVVVLSERRANVANRA